jgi:multidrug efflux pump subunit AcrA (membrane-fusion protein)
MDSNSQTLQPAPSCAYPPALAADAEIAPQPPSFIAGSASIGRYLLLGAPERRVLDLLDGVRTLGQVCEALPGVGVPELSRFLAKLDDVGLLAGERPHQVAALPGGQYYRRWSLFNPDPLFSRMLPWLRWIWTPPFFACSAALTAFAFLLIVLDWPAFTRHAGIALRSHYLGIFLAAWLVTVVHEFSHGLTAKAFGGRSTEVGFLLIYYLLPACYCNVSGIHMISSRGRRLWVIAAGIYSQLLLGAGALLVWLAFSPGTAIAQAAMVFALASLLDLLMNVNPLIKLDGYYFLSQWWRMPNLMDRSRACWRDVGRRLFLGTPPREAVRFQGRDRRLLLWFGGVSFLYNLALPLAIVWYSAQFLMHWFALPGLLGGGALAAAFALHPVKKTVQFWFGKENRMAGNEGVRPWRRFVPAGIGALILAGLLMPWMASVGSYGVLVAIPHRESVIRAPENASLVVLSVQPGQQVAAGASIAQMANLDMDERIAALRTELARVDADAERLAGERRVQQEESHTARWQLEQRRREFADVDEEDRQIRRRLPAPGRLPSGLRTTPAQFAAPTPATLPPALAALEAETERLHAEWTAVDHHRERTRALASEGIVAHSELDSVEWRAASLSSQLIAARDRLNAALIEHGRRRAKAQSEANVAGTNVAAAEAHSARLGRQIEAARKLHESLLATLSVLEQKRAQFTIPSPRVGTLFGEDLPGMLGKYFPKGAEICRVADTREVLVRIQVGEEALSDIRLGQNVRVKARSFPDRVFRGAVSKLGGEGEVGENGQRTYRLEFTIQNEEGLLKPGMTVFARADFGRRPIIWLLAHKLKQALRPEIWML